METENTSIWQWLVRGGVLALAVGVGVFIVRQNHEAAQSDTPQSEMRPERVQPAASDETSVVQRRTPESSGRVEGTPTKAPEALPEKKHVFFHTSKSMAPSEEILEFIQIPEPKVPPSKKPYFHSSKAFAPPPIEIQPSPALPVPR
jgi:hypothetical protein